MQSASESIFGLFSVGQGLVEVAGKPGSVVFSAYRDDDHTYSDDNFITFSGCHINIGSAFR